MVWTSKALAKKKLSITMTRSRQTTITHTKVEGTRAKPTRINIAKSITRRCKMEQ